MYCQTSIRCTKFSSSLPSWEWRCSWSSADRWCSNYIWVIKNFCLQTGKKILPTNWQLILEVSRYISGRLKIERGALKPTFWNEWLNEKNILGFILCAEHAEAEKFFQTPWYIYPTVLSFLVIYWYHVPCPVEWTVSMWLSMSIDWYPYLLRPQWADKHISCDKNCSLCAQAVLL